MRGAKKINYDVPDYAIRWEEFFLDGIDLKIAKIN